jgi:hypothetical protein
MLRSILLYAVLLAIGCAVSVALAMWLGLQDTIWGLAIFAVGVALLPPMAHNWIEEWLEDVRDRGGFQ